MLTWLDIALGVGAGLIGRSRPRRTASRTPRDSGPRTATKPAQAAWGLSWHSMNQSKRASPATRAVRAPLFQPSRSLPGRKGQVAHSRQGMRFLVVMAPHPSG